MIVVDSSVWIDHFRDLDTPAVRKLRAVENPGDIIVGHVVLLELLQRARDDRHAARIEVRLREFTISEMMSVEIARQASVIYRTLRADGKTVLKTVDLIIATFCLVEGHQLLHDDRDFAPIAERFHLQLA